MKLKEIRKENNKTQKEIADILNIPQRTYNEYELGQTEPTIDQLKKLSNLYNVSIDYLVDNKINNSNNLSLEEKQEKIIKKIEKMNTVQCARMHGYVDRLIEEYKENYTFK